MKIIIFCAFLLAGCATAQQLDDINHKLDRLLTYHQRFHAVSGTIYMLHEPEPTPRCVCP